MDMSSLISWRRKGRKEKAKGKRPCRFDMGSFFEEQFLFGGSAVSILLSPVEVLIEV